MGLPDLQRQEKYILDWLNKAISDEERRAAIKSLHMLYDNMSYIELQAGPNGARNHCDDRDKERQARKLAKKPRKEPLTPVQKIDRKNDRRTAILEQRARRDQKRNA